MTYTSGWKTMWVIALFDLPTETKVDRQEYTKFRKRLLEDGFAMMQFSVYIRHCASPENAVAHINKMGACTPPKGEVRFVTITDKQFSLIKTYWGKKRIANQNAPNQLELF